jgi:hypothetical protein
VNANEKLLIFNFGKSAAVLGAFTCAWRVNTERWNLGDIAVNTGPFCSTNGFE